MTRSSQITAALIFVTAVMTPTPVAHAAQSVTYEVVSANLSAVSTIEYFDGTARRSLQNVPLPWRTTVAIDDPRSLGTDGAEVRADWRSSIAAPVWRPGTWVTVRIYIGDILRCQNSLDIGNATCYGSTGFQS